MTEEMSFTLPAIHMNGSGKDRLLQNQMEVIRSLEAAMTALAAARPHPRDYYTLTDENAFTDAQEEHFRHERELQRILDEVTAYGVQLSQI